MACEAAHLSEVHSLIKDCSVSPASWFWREFREDTHRYLSMQFCSALRRESLFRSIVYMAFDLWNARSGFACLTDLTFQPVSI